MFCDKKKQQKTTMHPLCSKIYNSEKTGTYIQKN